MKNISFFNAFLTLFFLSSASFAGISTKIHDIEIIDNEIQVLASENGRVYTIESEKLADLEILNVAKENDLYVYLETTEVDPNDLTLETESILKAQLINFEIDASSAQKIQEYKNPMYNFEPTNISSIMEAKKLFTFLNPYTQRRSQCFNRAYVWSHELYTKLNIKSKKNFIFYTQKYRKEVNKKWWFHVSPVIVVNGEDYFLDREFTRGPKTRDEWEAIFISPLKQRYGKNFHCPMMDRMSTYDNTTFSAWCYHIESSMYFWGPNDLYAAEKELTLRTEFSDSILYTARKEAFKNWRSIWYDFQ